MDTSVPVVSEERLRNEDKDLLSLSVADLITYYKLPHLKDILHERGFSRAQTRQNKPGVAKMIYDYVRWRRSKGTTHVRTIPASLCNSISKPVNPYSICPYDHITSLTPSLTLNQSPKKNTTQMLKNQVPNTDVAGSVFYYSQGLQDFHLSGKRKYEKQEAPVSSVAKRTKFSPLDTNMGPLAAGQESGVSKNNNYVVDELPASESKKPSPSRGEIPVLPPTCSHHSQPQYSGSNSNMVLTPFGELSGPALPPPLDRGPPKPVLTAPSITSLGSVPPPLAPATTSVGVGTGEVKKTVVSTENLLRALTNQIMLNKALMQKIAMLQEDNAANTETRFVPRFMSPGGRLAI